MAKSPVPSIVIRKPQAPVVRRPAPSGFTFGGQPVGPAARPARRAAPAKYPVARPPFTFGGIGPQVAPVKTNALGEVANPSNTVSVLERPKAAPKKVAAPKVRVVVHPSGKIEVHQAAPASPNATPTEPAAPASTPKVNQDGPAAPAKPKPAPRVTATAAPVTPQTPLTVEQQAQNLLDPVKQSILDAINQRTDASQAAITNYAKDLAQMMGEYAPEANAAYGNAETGQSAIDAALAQTLSGAGASGQADLAAKLAQIDADPGTTARINGAAGTNAQGALGAAAGRGAASLSDLIGRAASAQDFGAKQPGLAGLYGLQATKSNQAKGVTDTASAVAQLEQQLPGVVQTLKTDTNQNKQLRFEHGVALLNANGGIVTPQIKSLLGGALPTGITQAGKTAKLKVQTEATNAATAAANAKVNAAYKAAMVGIQDRKLKQAVQKEHATAKAKGQHLGLSAKDWQNYNSLALSGARSAHNGTPDGTHPPVSWQQYLTIGLGEKIPVSILIDQGKKVYSQAEIRQGLIPGGKK